MERLSAFQIYAKIEGNAFLTNKANLLGTMSKYYKDNGIKEIFKFLPVTYMISACKNLNEDNQWEELYRFFQHEHCWICKPGENANRGKGIVVLPTLKDVRNFL